MSEVARAPLKNTVGQPIVAAAAFQTARRLKAGGGQDWPPDIGVSSESMRRRRPAWFAESARSGERWQGLPRNLEDPAPSARATVCQPMLSSRTVIWRM